MLRELVAAGVTQPHGVTVLRCGRKSPSSHSTWILPGGCYSKPRTAIRALCVFSADTTELPSSFCRDAAIRNQLSALSGLSASSTPPGHLKSVTTIDPITVKLNSQTPPVIRKEALEKITPSNLQVTDRAEEQLPKGTSSFSIQYLSIRNGL